MDRTEYGRHLYPTCKILAGYANQFLHQRSYGTPGREIQSFKDTSEKLWLQKRDRLKTSAHSLMNQLWAETSAKNIPSDELLMVSSNLNQAVKNLKKKQNTSSQNMFFSLECQEPL